MRPQRQRLDKMTRNYIAVLSCGRVGEIDVKICEETTCFVVSFGVAREEWRERLLQKATLEASGVQNDLLSFVTSTSPS